MPRKLLSLVADSRLVIRATIALLVAWLVSPFALASQGRTPIAKETVISQPGSYYVTKDISYGGGTVIDIQADDVTVDLDGHTLSSPGSTNILVHAVGRTNIRVTNGKLVGGRMGVSLAVGLGGPQIFVQVDNLIVRGQSGTGSKGIFITGEASGNKAVAVVRDNSVDAQLSTSICMELDELRNSSVENNVLENSWVAVPTGIGLGINGSERVKVKGNVASGNRFGGIGAWCNGCDISYNVSSGNGGGTNAAPGLFVGGNDNTVSFNTSSKNTNGIQIQGSGNAIFHNTACENSGVGADTGYGIWINDGNGPAVMFNVIELNRCAMNAAFGIIIKNAGNINNCLRNNSTPQASGNGRSIVPGQLCDSNNLP